MKTKAVIFDKDGTLLSFDAFWLPISAGVIEELAGEHRLAEEMWQALGVEEGTARIDGVLCSGTYTQIGQKLYAVLKRHGCRWEESDVIRRTVEAYHTYKERGMLKPACDHLWDVLQQLKHLGMKLAVVTTDDPFLTKKCLEDLGIADCFDAVYTDDGIVPAKPILTAFWTFAGKKGSWNRK